MEARKTAPHARKLQWALLILTLAFIWGHSCMPVADSAAESGFVTRLLAPLLELFVGPDGATDHLVRKLAHFTEFAVLGAQLLLLQLETKRTDVLRALEYTFFTAFMDESIQMLSGRGAQIIDVWLDAAGAAFGVTAVLGFIKINRNAGRV